MEHTSSTGDSFEPWHERNGEEYFQIGHANRNLGHKPWEIHKIVFSIVELVAIGSVALPFRR